MNKEEAIKIVRSHYPANKQMLNEALEFLIPELKESEDEKIRKSIIGFLNTISSLKDGKTVSNEDFDPKTILEWVAWLEKLEEFVSTDFDDVWETADCEKLTAPLEKYSKDAIKEMCHAWYDKGIELERKSWLEKQGENNPLEEGTFVNVDEVREDFIQEVYRVLDADPTNDRANQIIDAFDSLPTLEFEKQGKQKPIERKDFISIPFGAFDSEMVNETITIPDGCVATIEGNKIHIKKEGKTALEAIKEEKVDNANKVEPTADELRF